MNFLINSQNKSRILSGESLSSVEAVMYRYNPDFKIVKSYPGTLHDMKEINKLIENKNGWFNPTEDNLNIINNYFNQQTEIIEQELEKRMSFLYKKFERYAKAWFFMPYDYETYMNNENIISKLDRIENYIKGVSQLSKIKERLEQFENHINNFHTINNAKRTCSSTDLLEVTPNLKIQITENWIVPKQSVELKIKINDEETSEIRYVKDWDFDHIWTNR